MSESGSVGAACAVPEGRGSFEGRLPPASAARPHDGERRTLGFATKGVLPAALPMTWWLPQLLQWFAESDRGSLEKRQRLREKRCCPLCHCCCCCCCCRSSSSSPCAAGASLLLLLLLLLHLLLPLLFPLLPVAAIPSPLRAARPLGSGRRDSLRQENFQNGPFYEIRFHRTGSSMKSDFTDRAVL